MAGGQGGFGPGIEPPPEKKGGIFRTGRKKGKAVLLSGLVCPGLGQIYLGKRLKGGLIAAATLSFVGYFLYNMIVVMTSYMRFALEVSDPFNQAVVNPSVSIRGALIKGILLGVLPAIVLWIYSAADAYFLEKKSR